MKKNINIKIKHFLRFLKIPELKLLKKNTDIAV